MYTGVKIIDQELTIKARFSESTDDTVEYKYSNMERWQKAEVLVGEEQRPGFIDGLRVHFLDEFSILH